MLRNGRSYWLDIFCSRVMSEQRLKTRHVHHPTNRRPEVKNGVGWVKMTFSLEARGESDLLSFSASRGLMWSLYHFITHVPDSCGGQKKEWKPLDFELQIVMSLHVGAGNWIWVLGRAANAFTHWAVSLVPLHSVFIGRSIFLLSELCFHPCIFFLGLWCFCLPCEHLYASTEPSWKIQASLLSHDP